jgi:hypothetical protein
MSEAPKMTYADKPWLKSYKFGPYPLKKTLEPYPEVPLYQILYDTAEKFPNRPACLAFGKETSYRTLKDLVDRLATALASLGVKKGDMVATVIPNCLQFKRSFALKTVCPGSMQLKTKPNLKISSSPPGKIMVLIHQSYGIFREQCNSGHYWMNTNLIHRMLPLIPKRTLPSSVSPEAPPVCLKGSC